MLHEIMSVEDGEKMTRKTVTRETTRRRQSSATSWSSVGDGCCESCPRAGSRDFQISKAVMPNFALFAMCHARQIVCARKDVTY